MAHLHVVDGQAGGVKGTHDQGGQSSTAVAYGGGDAPASVGDACFALYVGSESGGNRLAAGGNPIAVPGDERCGGGGCP